VTRLVLKNMAQNVAKPIFGYKVIKLLPLSVIFKNTDQRKDPPNRRNFAQSGHPDCDHLFISTGPKREKRLYINI
jgi:hypothetical protein